MNKILIALLIVSIMITIMYVSEQRTKALMSLCADHETQTLHKCN